MYVVRDDRIWEMCERVRFQSNFVNGSHHGSIYFMLFSVSQCTMISKRLCFSCFLHFATLLIKTLRTSLMSLTFLWKTVNILSCYFLLSPVTFWESWARFYVVFFTEIPRPCHNQARHAYIHVQLFVFQIAVLFLWVVLKGARIVDNFLAKCVRYYSCLFDVKRFQNLFSFHYEGERGFV